MMDIKREERQKPRKRRIKVRNMAAGLVLSAAMLLSACAGKGGEAPPNPTATEATDSPAVATEAPAYPYVAPLTGVGRQTEAAERPIAVMINNLKPARPQSGLTNADVIWEVLAEGGVTRLIAIFQSTDRLTDNIGPIRSIRPYLIEIGETYGAVLAHAGASTDAYAILQQQKKPYLDEISNAGTYFWRSKDRKAPHNLYASLDKLRQGAEKRGYSAGKAVPVYSFLPEEDSVAAVTSTTNDTGVADVSHVEIMFTLKNYKVSYDYDKASGLYKRFINNEPHVDMNNNEQLSAANLVVLEASHKTLDDVGRLAVNLTSGGKAVLLQKGRVIDCEWVRAEDNMIRIMKDGAEVKLVQGKTFFHIVPNTPSFDEHVKYG
ncbi:DUF3048 domain-containing protein [Paenibacillus sp. NPDC058071]|uniref:DUF3048 domain-containing protein n=1 Tax=Paenibacillus sp. NPDC058071 TaxID=3346326 RepID=UPI0036DE2F94